MMWWKAQSSSYMMRSDVASPRMVVRRTSRALVNSVDAMLIYAQAPAFAHNIFLHLCQQTNQTEFTFSVFFPRHQGLLISALRFFLGAELLHSCFLCLLAHGNCYFSMPEIPANNIDLELLRRLAACHGQAEVFPRCTHIPA